MSLLFKLLLFVAALVADLVADLLTAHFAALVADETISSATPSFPDFHHCWVGNDDGEIGDKQIQNIHAICWFQVHALQRRIHDTACLPLSPPAH